MFYYVFLYCHHLHLIPADACEAECWYQTIEWEAVELSNVSTANEKTPKMWIVEE